MLAKLLALIAELKAAGVAVVVIAGAATATVAGTSADFQTTFQQLTTNIGQSQRCDDTKGQPAVVAQRNAADKLLRAAYQKDLKALNDLRGGKETDNKAVGEIVRKYSDLLRDRLELALNDSAAMTLGRTGQVRKAEASASPSGSPATSPSPTATTSASASPQPSCTPAPSASPTTSPTPTASPSPAASGSAGPEPRGREAVAERATLEAALQALVDDAVADMDEFVQKATDEAAAVPAAQRGKPSDNPGNKPSTNPGRKPSPTP